MPVVFAWLVRLLGPTVAKWVGYFVAILVLVGIAFLALKAHDAGIVAGAKLQYEKDQLEQTLKDKDAFIQQLQVQAKLNEEVRKELEKQIVDIQQNTSSAADWLNTVDATRDDRPSSNVIKNTFKMLYGVKE